MSQLLSNGELLKEDLQRAIDSWQTGLHNLRSLGYYHCILSLTEMEFVWKKLLVGESVVSEMMLFTDASPHRQKEIWRKNFEEVIVFAGRPTLSAKIEDRGALGTYFLEAFGTCMPQI